ncbi:hypothetical protein E2562_001657 [Oryza meyeriana var. granulata]|uniref:Uncharacterized protein n=2 Tax=Oryza meyeriana var. granulata TaxID=110450 RepID=A0A6G1CDX5_9ORYZ|nr:hypothetical protein E2562_001657 [Oryza meyeriana var. granulata]
MGGVKRSSYLSVVVVVVFALLFLTSMAAGGRKMLINKHQVQSMETSDESMQDDEMLVMVHERILRQVKTNDYGTYDPTPTMSKPHAKEIPN